MSKFDSYNMTIGTAPAKFIWFRVAKAGTRSTLAALRSRVTAFKIEQGFKVRYRPDDYSEYFKFCFVRDPYARIISGWNDKILKASSGGGKFDTDELGRLSNFDQFLGWLVAQDPAQVNIHFRPQSFLVPESVDAVGRLETYGDDLTRIFKRIGLPPLKDIPHRNKKRLPDDLPIYSKQRQRMVAEYFRADFERFGYDIRV